MVNTLKCFYCYSDVEPPLIALQQLKKKKLLQTATSLEDLKDPTQS